MPNSALSGGRIPSQILIVRSILAKAFITKFRTIERKTALARAIISSDDINKLNNDEVEFFSTDRLLTICTRLGINVKIEVT